MKNAASIFVKIIALLFAIINVACATDKYSIANGNWSTGTTWSNTYNGATCNCTPVKSDNIYIYNNVTLDKNLTGGGQGLTGIVTINPGASLNGGGTYSLEMRSGSTLTVHGSLTVGDLTYNSGGAVLVQSSGVVTVNGTFTNKMNSNNVTVNGTIVVNGTFANNNSGVINGTGSIHITNGPATNGASATAMGNAAASPCTSFPCTLGGGALPIELISFTAYRSSSAVQLNWTTASEAGNDHFTIERSADLSAWENMDIVKGAGNSIHELQYSYTDNHPPLTDCYYRLRQTDFDGNYKMFDPVFVEAVDASTLHLYPNPTSGNTVTLHLSDGTNASIIKVYNMSGAEVKTKISANRNNSNLILEIDADAVKLARMFFVTVIRGDKVLREKLLINQ